MTRSTPAFPALPHGLVLLLLVSVISATAATSARADHGPLLGQVEKNGWTVNFDPFFPYACMPGAGVPPGADGNFLPTGQAQEMLESITGPVTGAVSGDPPGYRAGYQGLGFTTPSAGDAPIFVYDCAPGGPHDDNDCDGGSAPDDRIRMPSTTYCAATPQRIRRVVGHEFFHHTQYEYIGFDRWTAWGRTAVEGSARLMEDQVFQDLDAATGGLFMRDANDYLAVPVPFWWASYDSVLGWKYATEQYGQIFTEPERGSDFVRAFWENAEFNNLVGADTPHTFEQTIQQFAPTKRLETWFHDFATANLLVGFDVSNLTQSEQDRFSYADENDGNGTAFNPVTPAVVASVPGPGSSGNTVVIFWSSTYLQGDNVDCNPGDIFGFRGKETLPGVGYLESGTRLRWSVAAIDGASGTPEVRDLSRGTGSEFGAAYFLSPTNDISQISAGITATGGAWSVDYAFDCGPGALTIQKPLPNYTTYVGPPGPERKTFGVVVRVTGPPGISEPGVRGIRSSDFSVYVGQNNVDLDKASVQSIAEVGGSYFLTVWPPDKGDTNTYDLHVNVGNITATQPSSVSYEDRVIHEMIALDTSGSMIFPGVPGGVPKIDAAKSGANEFVDWARSDGKIGAVEFSGSASLLEALGDATESHRDDVQDAISAIVPSPFASTSIGDGADRAADELVPASTPKSEDWILLLTDGVETAFPLWAQIEPAIVAAGIKVAAYGLGDDADHALLARIEDVTGGAYIPLDSDGSGATSAQGAGADPVPNAIADAFITVGELAEGLARLWQKEGSLLQGATDVFNLEIGEGGITDATFAFHWNDTSEDVTVQITRPDLSVVTDGVAGAEVRSGDAHVVFHVGALQQGTWQILVKANVGKPEYLGVLSGLDRQGTGLELALGGLHDDAAHAAAGIDYLWGLPQPIVAILTDKGGALSGATVTALVEHPDGGVQLLPLLDDGEHDDGAPDDGVYGNVYARTTSTNIAGAAGMQGAYRVVAFATGTNSLSESFVRVRKTNFLVEELNDPPPDTDSDGMPDRYEALHPCLDPLEMDGDGDPDLDGVATDDEWNVGTRPCHPDTDRGGESDGSEMLRGANPFDPSDDALPEPIDPEVIDWVAEHLPFPAGISLEPDTNLVRYPVNSTYTSMTIWRSTSAFGPFASIANLTGAGLTGLYADTGLVNGTTYYYMVQPGDLNGNKGAPSRIFWGTPKADPVPPIGTVIINDGAAVTDTTNASLSLIASLDTADMRIADDPGFAGAVWEPFSSSRGWTLVPDAAGLATVHVQYRDVNGNVSPTTYTDSVEVVSPGSLGAIDGQIVVGGLEDFSGTSIRVLGEASLPPVYTEASGKLVMPNLPPGTYTLVIERHGFEPLTITNVVVNAGETTNIGLIELAPLPVNEVPTLPGYGLALLVLAFAWLGHRLALRGPMARGVAAR